MALPPGVEPRSQASEAHILSIELQEQQKRSREDQEQGRQSQTPFSSANSPGIEVKLGRRNILGFDFCDG